MSEGYPPACPWLRDGAIASGHPRMTASEKYVAAAYLVVFVALLVYLLIIASKLQRLDRQLGDLVDALRERDIDSG